MGGDVPVLPASILDTPRGSRLSWRGRMASDSHSAPDITYIFLLKRAAERMMLHNVPSCW